MSDIPNVTLNNGVQMPQLGLGVWTIPDDQVAENVVTALANGYRMIDTAARYENETGVGKGIRDSGIPRKEIFVTSKLSYDDSGFYPAIKGFNASLERLGLDYIR
jgi:diketogulonate reductase-like aldo/keto reductase